MAAVLIGKTSLLECPRCEGIWADAGSLEQICVDREKQSAVLGLAATISSPETAELEKNIRYVPCPVCRKLMNRVNFAHCSKVIVDVCTQHGTWFDKDELRRIVEFIRSGGLEKSRARELEELEQRRRQLSAARGVEAWDIRNDSAPTNYEHWDTAIGAAATLLKSLLR